MRYTIHCKPCAMKCSAWHRYCPNMMSSWPCRELDRSPGPQLMAEIGDVRRFTSKGALVAFAGVDAPPVSIGAFDSKSRHVSKRGSPHLRRILFTICSVLLQQANPENAVFQFWNRKQCRKESISTFILWLAVRNFYASITRG